MSDTPTTAAAAAELFTIRDYGQGREVDDPGQWEEIHPALPATAATDDKPEQPARDALEFRLRAMPSNIHKNIEKKYGKEEQVSVDGRRVPQRILTGDERDALWMEKADWMWTDVRGLPIVAETQEAVEFYQRNGFPECELGQRVDLAGKLTSAVKRRLFTLQPRLVGIIHGRVEVRAREIVTGKQARSGN